MNDTGGARPLDPPMLRRLLALLLAVACMACAAAPARAEAVPSRASVNAAEASRQVLVMLRMPPAHFHAGADYGGYGAGADPGRPARRRLADELARAHGLRVVDDWPMPVIGVDCYVMERPAGVPDGQTALLSALASDPRVAWAQPVNLFDGQGQPAPHGDPLLPLQPDARLWHTAELHRASTGRGVRVAVVDSGIDSRHPDLDGQLDLNENFVDAGAPPAEAHGTAVAGVIAARAGNGVGVAGVAPDVRLMGLRACWEVAATDGARGARCSSFTLAKALNFAIQHAARVFNLSLGGPPDRLLQTLVETAIGRGATVVGAVDPVRPDGFPAAVPGVVAAAAPAARAPTLAGAPPRTGAGAPAAILLAPGSDVPVCLPGARWGFASGSSYAAAQVSGLLALLAQLRPGASGAELRRLVVAAGASPALEQTARHGADPPSGGTIDACASIARATKACVCSCHPIGTLEANRVP